MEKRKHLENQSELVLDTLYVLSSPRRTIKILSKLFLSSLPNLPPPPSRILDSCQHWYELMVGKLLFTSPLVVSSDYDLVYTAEVSVCVE